MDYNSQRKKLILPEYGRNIQMMVDHLATITDRDERTRAAKTVISVMGNLYPHLRDVPDFRHKLWDHLMIMSNFTLDIDSPYPLPEKDILEEKPEKLPYNNHRIKYKHYGLLTEKLIEKIKETEDPEIKRVLTVLTANHMKKSFLTWNKRLRGRRSNLQRHQYIIRWQYRNAGRNDPFSLERLVAEEKYQTHE